MPITLNTNTIALEALHNVDLTSMSFTQAVQRLSSGLRINSAADDPSGLAVSQKLIAQINGFDQAQRNTQDAVSLIQTAQAGLDETMTDLQRLNTLAVQASNGTLTSSDLQNIQLEVQGLVQDINRVAQQTTFNGQTLLNGSSGAVVQGGGPNVTDLQVEAGVVSGTGLITGSQNATQATITGGAAPAASTFAGGGSVTLTGPAGVSATFTSFAGETVSNFIQQVNDANIGITASTNGAGQVVLTSQDFGVKGNDTRATPVNNASGPQFITATGNAADVDFGSGAGAKLEIISGSGATNNSATILNASVTLKVTPTGGAATSVTVALTGVNSDQFSGTGIASGISFRVVNPGAITTNVDTFTFTQHGPLDFQVGANQNDTMGIAIDAQNAESLGVNGVDLTTQTGAESAITVVQNAINQVSATQANLGALQNRLTNAQTNAGAAELNAQTANSNLVDANIAQEAVNFARDQIVLQAGVSVLAQANQLPGSLLGLLGSLPGPSH